MRGMDIFGRAIDHMEILSRTLEYEFNPETEAHYSLDRDLLVLKIPDFTWKFGLGRDEIVPGISIVNSEVGIDSFSRQFNLTKRKSEAAQSA